MKKVNVLFVCTGNVYRSQIAEYLSKRMFTNIVSSSAGLDGLHAGKTVGQVWKKTHLESVGDDLKALDINIMGNKCKLITKRDVENADKIFVMDEQERKIFVRKFPESVSKVSMLGKFAHLKNPEIYDLPLEPDVGKTVAKIRRALENIKKEKLC